MCNICIIISNSQMWLMALRYNDLGYDGLVVNVLCWDHKVTGSTPSTPNPEQGLLHCNIICFWAIVGYCKSLWIKAFAKSHVLLSKLYTIIMCTICVMFVLIICECFTLWSYNRLTVCVNTLQVCLDLVRLLHYLSLSPLGSVGLLDFQPRQFVMVSGELKLTDLDDAVVAESKCQMNSDCLLEFPLQNFTFPCLASGVCQGLSEMRNLYNAYRLVLLLFLVYYLN